MGDQDAFERILASLHDAMLDDSRWPGTRLLCRRASTTPPTTPPIATTGNAYNPPPTHAA